MKDLFFLIGFLAVVVVLQRFVLPRLGLG